MSVLNSSLKWQKVFYIEKLRYVDNQRNKTILSQELCVFIVVKRAACDLLFAIFSRSFQPRRHNTKRSMCARNKCSSTIEAHIYCRSTRRLPQLKQGAQFNLSTGVRQASKCVAFVLFVSLHIWSLGRHQLSTTDCRTRWARAAAESSVNKHEARRRRSCKSVTRCFNAQQHDGDC